MRLPLIAAATSALALVGCPTNNTTTDAALAPDASVAVDALPPNDAYQPSDAAGDAASAARFVVRGVSGSDIVLDRTWDRGCVSGGPGMWTHSRRTLTGLELATTITDYLNSSTTPDCTNGRAIVTTFTQTLTNDHVNVPITWVDATFMPTAAPAGLESVTQGIGASGVLSVATRTAITAEGAASLNSTMFCGIRDWAPGAARDLIPCFGTTGRGTIIVDDRTLPWHVYDGVGTDPTMYPTFMPTVFHQGPIEGP